MITALIGKRGSGKTYYAVKIILKEIKKRRVITNIFLKNVKNENYIYRSVDEILKNIKKETNCLYVIDESGIYFNNREYKKFDKNLYDMLVMSRHYKIDFVFIVQNLSRVDVIIRELVDEIIKLKRIFCIVMMYRISKTIELNEEKTDFIDKYYFINRVPRIFILKKKIFKYFDSFYDELKLKKE